MRRSLLFGILLLLGFLVSADLLLRAISTRRGHIDYLLAKPWYYLVPFGIPAEVPDTRTIAGAYRRYDPHLGWTLSENGHDPPLYCSGPTGHRTSCMESPQEGPRRRHLGGEGSVDVIAIGDSFTHGDEVAFEETWPYQIGVKGHWRVENLGVGGYGIDQAVHRYERSETRGKLVLLGLIAGDMERSRTLIYRYSGGGLKTKPIFAFENGRHRLINQPAIRGEALMRELRRREESVLLSQDLIFGSSMFRRRQALDFSFLYRTGKSILVWRQVKKPPIYRTDDDRLTYCLRILQHLQTITTRRRAGLIVLLLGNNNTFADRQELERPWLLLEERLSELGISYFNTADRLFELYVEEPDSVINSFGVHYTPEAHEQIADQLIASGLLETALSTTKIPSGKPAATSSSFAIASSTSPPGSRRPPSAVVRDP